MRQIAPALQTVAVPDGRGVCNCPINGPVPPAAPKHDKLKTNGDQFHIILKFETPVGNLGDNLVKPATVEQSGTFQPGALILNER